MGKSQHAFQSSKSYSAMEDDYHIEESVALTEKFDIMAVTDNTTKKVKDILDAKCTAADLNVIAQEQMQMSEAEKKELLTLLERYKGLFDGTPGKWTEDPINIELKEGTVPHHAHPFPIPRCHVETLKMEVAQLVEFY